MALQAVSDWGMTLLAILMLGVLAWLIQYGLNGGLR
jgi:hypothetical protein